MLADLNTNTRENMTLDLNAVCDRDRFKLFILSLQTIKANVKKVWTQKHPSVVWQTENKLQLSVADHYSLQWQAEEAVLVRAQLPWQKIHKHNLSSS